MPVAGKAIGDTVKGLLDERGIEFLPSHKPTQIDPLKRIATYENGAQVEFSILGAMPPHRAPGIVREAGLTDASGFVPVDLWNLQSRVSGVYAVGDVAGLKLPNGNPHPKAGAFAEAQAFTVARCILAEISGSQPVRYGGTGICYVETGRGMAAPAEINLLSPEGVKFNFKQLSKEGLEAKQIFERDHFARWFGG